MGQDVPWDHAAAAYAAVCDLAAELGLLVHIEYFPYSGLDSLGAAWEVARRADRRNGGVMVDLWHHVRGPDAGTTAFAAPGDQILAVQVGDVAAVAWDDRRAEMMHGRRLPGEGAGDVVGSAPGPAGPGLHGAARGGGVQRRAHRGGPHGGRPPRHGGDAGGPVRAVSPARARSRPSAGPGREVGSGAPEARVREDGRLVAGVAGEDVGARRHQRVDAVEDVVG